MDSTDDQDTLDDSSSEDSKDDDDSDGNTWVEISRPALTQRQFFKLEGRNFEDDSNSCSSQLPKPNRRSLVNFAKGLFPILTWLPKYNAKRDLLADISAGTTVAFLQIPQGMAYALLASVDPITGIYSGFFPSLPYILMGTSHHVSLGAFAVTSIIASSVVEEYSGNYTKASLNATLENNYSPIEVASTVTFLAGIMQLVLGCLHLGFLTSVLSSALVSGYTTAVAIHIASSQIKYIFGVHIPSHSGMFQLPKFYATLTARLSKSNLPTLFLSAAFLSVLFIYDFLLKERVTRRLRGFTFPIHLFCVVLGIALSYLVGLDGSPYNVDIVDDVPSGFPSPMLPKLDLFVPLFKTAFTVAIVGYVASYFVMTVLAQKHDYHIRPNQEILALGASNSFGALFSSVLVAASLSRSSVQDAAGGRTMVTTAVSVFTLMWVILFAGPMLEPLPKAVLAAITIASLTGMFSQCLRLPRFARESRFDGVVWVATFLATVVLGVDVGLAAGAAVNGAAVLVKALIPKVDVKAKEIHQDLVLVNFMTATSLSYQMSEAATKYPMVSIGGSLDFANTSGLRDVIERELEDMSVAEGSRVFLDLTRMVSVDPSGCHALSQTVRHMKAAMGLEVAIIGVPYSAWRQMEACKVFHAVPKNTFFPTFHDAMASFTEQQQRKNIEK